MLTLAFSSVVAWILLGIISYKELGWWAPALLAVAFFGGLAMDLRHRNQVLGSKKGG